MDEANTGITLRCWQLYWNHGIGTGDAYFLAVAQDFGAELWTTDGPFYTAASAVYTNTHNLYDKQFN